METVTFEADYTKKEFVDFRMWAAFVRGYRLTLMIILLAVFVLCDATVIALEAGFPTPPDALMLFLLIFSNVIIVLMPLLIRFQAGRAYDSNKLRKPAVFTFTDGSIFISDGMSNIELTKDKVHRVYFTKRYIYIAASTEMFFILPKDRIPEDKREWVTARIQELGPVK